jgi:hypothetical protein
MRKSAGIGFPAGAAIAVLLAATLAGCSFTPYDVMMRERQHAEDEQACTSSGNKPGTNQFAKCMQERELARMRGTFIDTRAAASSS